MLLENLPDLSYAEFSLLQCFLLLTGGKQMLILCPGEQN